MLTEKECTNCCYMTLSLFSYFYLKYSHIINTLKSEVPSTLKIRLFQQLTSQIYKTLMRCAKKLHFLNYSSHKMNKFLFKTFNSEIYIRNKPVFQYLFLLSRSASAVKKVISTCPGLNLVQSIFSCLSAL